LLSRKLRLFGNPAFLMKICWSCKFCIIPLIVVLFVIHTHTHIYIFVIAILGEYFAIKQ
jgi:hypothetical protein